MLERRDITVDNRRGLTRKVYSSRPKIVAVELLANSDQRHAVLATPMPSFSKETDYLVAIVKDGERVKVDTLYGDTPAWAKNLVGDEPATEVGAQLIAWPGMR